MTLKKLIKEIEKLEGHKVSLQTQLDKCKANISLDKLRDDARYYRDNMGYFEQLFYSNEINIKVINEYFDIMNKFMDEFENNKYNNDKTAKVLYATIKHIYKYNSDSKFTKYIENIELNKEIFSTQS
jgi:hypothetical protein